MKRISEKVRVIHGQFVEYGRNAREWTRKCEMLLPHVERERVWEKKGYASIYHYAAVLAGMSRPKVDEALRVMRGIEDKPELLRVAEQKGLQAVRPVVALATQETASFWAEKSEILSKNTLEVYVKEWKKLDGERKIQSVGQAEILPREDLELELRMYLRQETIDELKKLKGPESWENLMKEFLEMRREKLEAQKPEAVRVERKSGEAGSNMNRTKMGVSGEAKSGQQGTKKAYHSRPAPAKIKKYIRRKTNDQCAFPGCCKPARIDHHSERFALKREHDPDKIAPMCEEHERLVHSGLVANEEMEPKFWRVRAYADERDKKFKIDKIVMAHRKGSG